MERVEANTAFEMQPAAEQAQPLLNITRHISHTRVGAGEQNVRIALVLQRDEFSAGRPVDRRKQADVDLIVVVVCPHVYHLLLPSVKNGFIDSSWMSSPPLEQ